MDGMKRALFQVHETQAFWALPGGEPAAIKQNAGIAYKAVCTLHLGLLMPLRSFFAAGRLHEAGQHSFWLGPHQNPSLSPVFWVLAASVQRVDYEHLDKEPSSVLLNIVPGAEPLVKVGRAAQETTWAALTEVEAVWPDAATGTT